MHHDELIEIIDCNTWLDRLRGLAGRSLELKTQALWLRPCRSIHTFTLANPISVAFVSSDYRVLKIHPIVQRFSIRWHWQAESVFEAAPISALEIQRYQRKLEMSLQQHLSKSR